METFIIEAKEVIKRRDMIFHEHVCDGAHPIIARGRKPPRGNHQHFGKIDRVRRGKGG